MMKAPKTTSRNIQHLFESYGFSSSQIPTEILTELTVNSEAEMQLKPKDEEDYTGSWLDFLVVVGVMGGLLLSSSVALGTASHTLVEIAKPYLSSVAVPNVR